MKLADYMAPDRAIFLAGSTKREAILELVEVTAATFQVPDRATLQRALLHREELMSTGIGLGIGVPHVRLEGIAEPCVAVGIHKGGIRDYESLDGEPVHIVVLIIAGKTQHAEYIRLLAIVTSFLKDAAVRARLIAAETPRAIHEILTEARDA